MQKKTRETEIPNERTLASMVQRQIWLAMGWMGGELSSTRAMATNYYLGTTFGDEISNASQSYGLSPDGRSRVNSLDVMDSIEWAMPSLMRIFMGSETPMRFDPVTEEDEEQAMQATDYVLYQMFKKNPGYTIFNSWMKDALLNKIGVVKCWWEDSVDYKQESYENLTDEEYLALYNNPDLELKKHEEVEVLYEGMDIIRDKKLLKKYRAQSPEHASEIKKLHDVVFMHKYNNSGIRIEVIPPEYFGITRNQRRPDFQDCEFCYMRVDMPRYKLIEMGFEKDLVLELNYSDWLDNPEQIARYNLIDERRAGIYESTDPMTQIVPLYECYVRFDSDDDGIAELHKVWWAANVVLVDEIVDEIPFHVLTPLIVPHKFFGLSMYELVADIQRIKSILLRQTIDNISLQNDRTTIIDRNKVPVEDLLISRPGKVVRVDGAPQEAVMYAPQSGIGDAPFTLLEYMDKVKEGRIGVGQTTQGLNMDLLNNNKGDASVMQMISASEQRLECIARTFAETGVKSLFLAIYRLLLKHQDKGTVVKLRNKWVEVDPTSWSDRADISINVGLGSGDRAKQAMALMQNLQLQSQVAQQGGMNVLVTPKNIYRNMVDLLEMQGVRFPDLYWQDPESPQAQQAQQQSAQNAKNNDPQAQALQAQMSIEQARLKHANDKLQTEKQLKLMQLKAEHLKQQHQQELELLKFSLEAHDNAQTHKDRELDMALKYKDNHLKHFQMLQGGQVDGQKNNQK